MEKKTLKVERNGELGVFCVRKMQPQNEANYVQVSQLIPNGDGTHRVVNRVRFYGSEFGKRIWAQKGFNREAITLLMQRYFTALDKAREEAQKAKTA
jgi:hypothetical protein